MTEVYLGMPPSRMAAWLRSRSKKQDAGDEIIWIKYVLDGEYVGSCLCMKNEHGDFEDAYMDLDGKVLPAKALYGSEAMRFVEGDDEWYCEYIDP